MAEPLKSKAAMTDEEVSAVWDRIRAGDGPISREQAERAVDEAAAEIRRTVGGARTIYGYSAGKDSICLAPVIEASGLKIRPIIGLIKEFEWTDYLKWVLVNGPKDLHPFVNTDLTMAKLAAMPDFDKYLFPYDGDGTYFWALNGTRRGQALAQETYNPAFQIYGRRKQDGNVCGDENGISYSQEYGITSYNPIRDWTHEMVLSVIHFAGLTLPPTYEHPRGWTSGTGPWSGHKQRGTIEEAWAEVYEIEPGAVVRASHHFASAYDFLEVHGS